MKIFISWSGDLSKSIAEAFRQWIPGVIQAAQPYYSPDDITKGTRWNSEISKELNSSKVGIICLTKENLKSPWIMFEAGALSKNLEKSKVCPLLFGLDPSDNQGPLVQFQAAKFSRSEVKKVIKMINSELEEGQLSDEVLNDVFEMWWPKLESKIGNILKNAKPKGDTTLRTEKDILEEVLSLTREMSISQKHQNGEFFHPDAFRELVFHVKDLAEFSYSVEAPIFIDSIREIFNIIEYILGKGRSYWGSSYEKEISSELKELRRIIGNHPLA